jgi:hypothetical protein
VVGVVALVPLGHWLGSAGVGIAYLVAVAVTSAIPLHATWRRYGMAWAGPTVRSFTVVLAALAAAELLEATGPYGSRQVVFDILAAAGVLALGSLLLRRDIAYVVAARHA